MRDIKFSFSISQGYGDKLFEVSRVIARTIATDSFDERQAQEDKLLAMASRFERIGFAAALEVIDILRVPDGEALTPKSASFTLKVSASTRSDGHYSTALDIAEITMDAKTLANVATDRQTVSDACEKVETAAVGMMLDLLVANGLIRPAADIITGEDAETIAATCRAYETAAELNARLHRAIRMTEEAQTMTQEARIKLRAIMASQGIEEAAPACPSEP